MPRDVYIGQRPPISRLAEGDTFVVVPAEVTVTMQEIDLMSAEQLREKMVRQPGFAQAVDRAYEARYAPSAVPEPTPEPEVPAVVPDPTPTT